MCRDVPTSDEPTATPLMAMPLESAPVVDQHVVDVPSADAVPRAEQKALEDLPRRYELAMNALKEIAFDLLSSPRTAAAKVLRAIKGGAVATEAELFASAASSPPNRGGVRQQRRADNGQHATARPLREPTPAQKG